MSINKKKSNRRHYDFISHSAISLTDPPNGSRMHTYTHTHAHTLSLRLSRTILSFVISCIYTSFVSFRRNAHITCVSVYCCFIFPFFFSWRMICVWIFGDTIFVVVVVVVTVLFSLSIQTEWNDVGLKHVTVPLLFTFFLCVSVHINSLTSCASAGVCCIYMCIIK